MGRRRRHRQRTTKPAEERQQDILDAALELFHEKGFAETNVGDIAEGAGVATGTVYLYFPSKEHMLLALHEDFENGMEARFSAVVGEAIERMARGEPSEPYDVVGSVCDALVDYLLERRRVCEVITRHLPAPDLMPKVLEAERGFVQLMARSFEAGIQAGRFHTSDPEMTAYLVNAAMSWTMAFSLTYGEPADFDRVVAQAKELLFKALAPTEGTKKKDPKGC